MYRTMSLLILVLSQVVIDPIAADSDKSPYPNMRPWRGTCRQAQPTRSP